MTAENARCTNTVPSIAHTCKAKNSSILAFHTSSNISFNKRLSAARVHSNVEIETILNTLFCFYGCRHKTLSLVTSCHDLTSAQLQCLYLAVIYNDACLQPINAMRSTSARKLFLKLATKRYSSEHCQTTHRATSLQH